MSDGTQEQSLKDFLKTASTEEVIALMEKLVAERPELKELFLQVLTKRQTA